MAVARFRPDGSLDASFDPDGDGKKIFGAAEQPASPTAMVLQPDGRIVVVGCCVRQRRLRGHAAERRRFGGRHQLRGRRLPFYPNAVALQPDGKIVVAGDAAASNSPPRMAVARYNLDGTLDDTFGGTRTFGAGDIVSAQAVLVQPDGKIVVAGYGNDDIDFVVTRLNSDGTFDTTFGAGGTSTIDFGLVEGAYAALLQPDGKIVVAGMAQPSLTDADFAVARLRPDGRLDTTFGSDGKTTVTSGAIEFAYAAALQPDGRIVLAGYNAGGEPRRRGRASRGRHAASSRRRAERRRRPHGADPVALVGVAASLPLGAPRHHPDGRAQRAGTRALRRPGGEHGSPRRHALPQADARQSQAAALHAAHARGGFSRSLAAGRSTLAFSGRALRPGRYTLRATPTDGAGNTGNRRAIALRIVRP